jgi:hypothetical protein
MHPDVAHEISELIADLQVHNSDPARREHRMGWALRLGDLFESGGEPTITSGLVEDLITLVIPNEPDVHVRNALFDAVVTAARKSTLDVALDPLVHAVAEDDPAFTCGVLQVMASLGGDKWIPFVRERLTHPNDFIRKNAEHAWKHRYRERAEKTGG